MHCEDLLAIHRVSTCLLVRMVIMDRCRFSEARRRVLLESRGLKAAPRRSSGLGRNHNRRSERRGDSQGWWWAAPGQDDGP